MKKLFDKLEDETPPTIGKEIGTALITAMSGMNKTNEAMSTQMAAMVSKAIADAILAVSSKQIVIEKAEKQTVKQWVFTVERDNKGVMSKIVATAQV